MAARNLGIHRDTSSLMEQSSEDLWDTVKEAGMDKDAKTILTMDVLVSRLTTVFCRNINMIKLHMVDDKLHACSVGPYSMVTQQPLEGKLSLVDNVSGKWLWALIWCIKCLKNLTYKSDDVTDV